MCTCACVHVAGNSPRVRVVVAAAAVVVVVVVVVIVVVVVVVVVVLVVVVVAVVGIRHPWQKCHKKVSQNIPFPTTCMYLVCIETFLEIALMGVK